MEYHLTAVTQIFSKHLTQIKVQGMIGTIHELNLFSQETLRKCPHDSRANKGVEEGQVTGELFRIKLWLHGNRGNVIFSVGSWM